MTSGTAISPRLRPVTVTQAGKTIEAVAQTTKHGYVFLFDRATGKPLFPIEYREYSASTVPGEVAAGTQPLPTKPAPFARQRLTEDMLTTRTPEAHAWALEQFRKFRSDGQFVPFAVGQETVIFPGYDGGAEWGGSAFDPETGLLYVNANDLPWTGAPAHQGADIFTSATATAPPTPRLAQRHSHPHDRRTDHRSSAGFAACPASQHHPADLRAIVAYSPPARRTTAAPPSDLPTASPATEIPRPDGPPRPPSCSSCHQSQHRRLRLEDSLANIPPRRQGHQDT